MKKILIIAFLSTTSITFANTDIKAFIDGYKASHEGKINEIIKPEMEKMQAQLAAANTKRQAEYMARMQEEQKKAFEKQKENQPLLSKEKFPLLVEAKGGDVVVTEFYDYNCGYCKTLVPQLVKIGQEDPKVTIQLVDYAFLAPSSLPAAAFSLAAGKQVPYANVHKALMEHKGALDAAALEKIATDLKLDSVKLQKDMSSDDVLKQLGRNRLLAGALEVNGTPALFVNGVAVQGGGNLQGLKDTIKMVREKGIK